MRFVVTSIISVGAASHLKGAATLSTKGMTYVLALVAVYGSIHPRYVACRLRLANKPLITSPYRGTSSPLRPVSHESNQFVGNYDDDGWIFMAEGPLESGAPNQSLGMRSEV